MGLILAKSVGSNEMHHYAAFYLGLHCLLKYSLMVSSIQRVKNNTINNITCSNFSYKVFCLLLTRCELKFTLLKLETCFATDQTHHNKSLYSWGKPHSLSILSKDHKPVNRIYRTQHNYRKYRQTQRGIELLGV